MTRARSILTLDALALCAGPRESKAGPVLERLLDEVSEKHCPYAAFLERDGDIFGSVDVLVEDDFYVLTSDNVTERTGDIHVWFKSTRTSQFKAKVVWADAPAGIAVLQIDDHSFRLDRRRAQVLKDAGGGEEGRPRVAGGRHGRQC